MNWNDLPGHLLMLPLLYFFSITHQEQQAGPQSWLWNICKQQHVSVSLHTCLDSNTKITRSGVLQLSQQSLTADLMQYYRRLFTDSTENIFTLFLAGIQKLPVISVPIYFIVIVYQSQSENRTNKAANFRFQVYCPWICVITVKTSDM